LLRALLPIIENKTSEWDLNVYVGMGKILNLRDLAGYLSLESSSKCTAGSHPNFGQQFRLVRVKLQFDSWLYNWMQNSLPEPLIDFINMIKRGVYLLTDSIMFLLGRGHSSDFGYFDVIHLTLPQFYQAIPDQGIPLLTTIHDLSHRRYPQFHTKSNVDNTEAAMKFTIARDSSYIAVSESTRRDLFKEYPEIANKRIFTVHEACVILASFTLSTTPKE
jgi:hypothetical protein